MAPLAAIFAASTFVIVITLVAIVITALVVIVIIAARPLVAQPLFAHFAEGIGIRGAKGPRYSFAAQRVHSAHACTSCARQCTVLSAVNGWGLPSDGEAHGHNSVHDDSAPQGRGLIKVIRRP